MRDTAELTPIDATPMGAEPTTRPLIKTPTPAEAVLLALILVAAFHAIPDWIMRFLPSRQLYEKLGPHGYSTLHDALSCVMPLLLCVGVPSRSGLTLGSWSGKVLKIVGVCASAIVLTALIYPLTSRPFSGGRIGSWLISPAAQELLFAGYVYGLIDVTFPVRIHKKSQVRLAVILTAVFFAIWHVPNFRNMSASYVAFQLLYTSLGGAWVLLARQWTGSIIPGLLTHMACNFISWL